MKYTVLALALLAGCGTAPPATVEIRVPVSAPCVTAAPARPVYEFALLPLDSPDGAKILALARDWPRGRKYEGELEAALAGCLPLDAAPTAPPAAPAQSK